MNIEFQSLRQRHVLDKLMTFFRVVSFYCEVPIQVANYVNNYLKTNSKLVY